MLRLPPTPRPRTEQPRLVAPCFRRGPDGTRAEACESRPAILGLDGTDFVDVLLRGAGEIEGAAGRPPSPGLRPPSPASGRGEGGAWPPSPAGGRGGVWPPSWPRQRAHRDWCEPPRSCFDPNGQPRFISNLRRTAPAPGELHEGDLDAALQAEEAAGPAWIRKLYLPYHLRFYAVVVELVCDRHGLPPLDRGRVIAQGLVLRRLIPDPRRERWQDWVAGPDMGAWVEIAGADLSAADVALDPTQPKLDPTTRVSLLQRLGLSTGTPLRLATTPLTPLPPGSGPGRRTTSFGILSLFSSEQEAPPLDLADAARLAEQAIVDLREALGLGDGPPGEGVWPDLDLEDPQGWLATLRAARATLLGRLGDEADETATATELGVDVEARLGAEAARSSGAIPGWPPPTGDAAWEAAMQAHAEGVRIERRISDLETALSAGGEVAWTELSAMEQDPESDPLLSRLARLPGPRRRDVEDFIHRVARRLASQGQADPCPPRARLDPDHVYAAWVYTRVRAADPCCRADRIVWSRRTEPFCIAEPMDLLGLRPAQIRLPDLGKLARDLPRIPKAGAFPMAVVTTPPDSGFSTTDEAKDTAREWGIAWICSIGIPVLTFCAWVMFSFIFKILIALPGFTWMLLLKLCVPVPVPKKEGA